MLGVEGAFHALLMLQVVLAEHFGHQVALFDAHPVLAGQHTAHRHAEAQDVVAEFLGPMKFALLVRIVKDQRVEIAVAGMKDIGDPQIVFLRQGLHARQHLGQFLAGDRAVHAVIVRRNATDGGEGGLAAGPEGGALLLRLRDAAGNSAIFVADRFHLGEEMIDLGLRPVELHDEKRLDVARIAGLNEVFRRVDGRPVHHLHTAGNDALGDDLGDAFARLFRCRKTDEHGPRRFGLLEDAHGDLGDDAQKAFGTGHEAEKVVTALGVEMLAAEAHHLALDGHELDAKHVVRRQTVFEAVNTAGILSDIAADRTGDLGGGVRGIIEAAMLDGLGDAEIGHPRLHDRAAIVVIDLEHAIELRQDEKDAILKRQSAAR